MFRSWRHGAPFVQPMSTDSAGPWAHARSCVFSAPEPALSSSGGSRTRPATAWSYEVPDPQGARRLWFETAPGVFSADGPDPGTILLLETLLPRIKSHER